MSVKQKRELTVTTFTSKNAEIKDLLTSEASWNSAYLISAPGWEKSVYGLFVGGEKSAEGLDLVVIDNGTVANKHAPLVKTKVQQLTEEFRRYCAHANSNDGSFERLMSFFSRDAVVRADTCVLNAKRKRSDTMFGQKAGAAGHSTLRKKNANGTGTDS